MKRLLVLGILLTLATSSFGQRNRLRQHPFLQPGDTVAILTPSSALNDSAVVDKTIKVLEDWGYSSVVGEHVFSRWMGPDSAWYAGTPEERAADIIWALREPSVKAVLFTRGGHGCINTVECIPREEFIRNPKWIMGYSDVTVLLSAQVSVGNMAIHSDMSYALALQEGRDTSCQYMRRMMMGDIPEYSFRTDRRDRRGRAGGILFGGNLSLLNKVLDSSYNAFDTTDGIILFIEDVYESIPSVTAMMDRLREHGVLDKVKGVMVGEFNEMKGTDQEGTYDLLDGYFRDLGVPVCYGVPVGHVDLQNYPLLEGCKAVLKVGRKGSTLRFNYRGKRP